MDTLTCCWCLLEVPTLLLPAVACCCLLLPAVACCCLLLCAVACWSTGNSESRPRGDRGTRIVHSTLQKARGGKKKRQSQSIHIHIHMTSSQHCSIVMSPVA